MIKKRNVKSSYVLRVVVVLAVGFIAISSYIIWNAMNHIIIEVDSRLAEISKDIKQELRYAESPNEDQQLFEKQATVIINRYMYENYWDIYPYMKDAMFGISLYKATIEEDKKNDTDWYADAEIEAVMLAENLLIGQFLELDPRENPKDEIYVDLGVLVISIDELCDENQIDEIQQIVGSTKENSIEIKNVKGYVDGHFFRPITIELSDGEKSVYIEKNDISSTQKIHEVVIEEPQITLRDGNVYGDNYTILDESLYKLIDKYYEQNKYDFFAGDGDGELSTEINYVQSEVANGYNVLVISKPAYLRTAINESFLQCLMLLIWFVVIALYLIVEFDNLVGLRMKAEQRRRGVMDSLAHDMKTPLAVIRNYSEILLEKSSDEQQNRFLNKIIAETEALNESIVSVLDLSKMEAEAYPMELSSVSISDIVNDVIKRKEILLEKKALKVELDINESDRIVADEKLISSVLINYLSNAVTHSPLNGTIKIRIFCDGRLLRIEIKNQGPRIDESEKEKIWDEYYGNKKVNKESSGIGLAIVKNVCQLHNGSYGCMNEMDGVTFWAEVNTMEPEIFNIEKRTEAVIGVTHRTSLNGLKAIAVGCFVEIVCLFCYAVDPSMDIAYKIGMISKMILIIMGIIMLEKGTDCIYFTKVNKIICFVILTSSVINLWLNSLSVNLIVSGITSICVFKICEDITCRRDNLMSYKELRLGYVLFCICIGLSVVAAQFASFKMVGILGTCLLLIAEITTCYFTIIVYLQNNKLETLSVHANIRECKWKEYILENNNRFYSLKILAMGFVVMAFGQLGGYRVWIYEGQAEWLHFFFTPGYRWLMFGSILIFWGVKWLYSIEARSYKIDILAKGNLLISLILAIYEFIECIETSGDYWWKYNVINTLENAQCAITFIIALMVTRHCMKNFALDIKEHILLKRVSCVFVASYFLSIFFMKYFYIPVGLGGGIGFHNLPLMLAPYIIIGGTWIKVYLDLKKNNSLL